MLNIGSECLMIEHLFIILYFTSFITYALSFWGNPIRLSLYVLAIDSSFEYFLYHLTIFPQFIAYILLLLSKNYLKKMVFLPCIIYQNLRPFLFYDYYI